MKLYTVKDWFANKIANEVKRNISMCDVFCILRETEKAIYAVMNLGTHFCKTMWIPKSVIVLTESENSETIHIEDLDREEEKATYETVIKEFHRFWDDYT